MGQVIGIGIDYGHGKTNIDIQTGIRYGVIPYIDLIEWALNEFTPEYGEAFCPECGGELLAESEESDNEYTCSECAESFNDGHELGYTDNPSNILDDHEYTAALDEYGDIFITESPYYTHAGLCSPCVPGAGHLRSIVEDGYKTFCFGNEWFKGGKAPYPVYSVKTNKLVEIK